MKFLASTVPEILGGPKIWKVGHVTHMTPIDLILEILDISSRLKSVCQIWRE